MKIGISATEPSGDLLGAELITALNQYSDVSLEFYGVGGNAMQTAGLKSLFNIEQLAVMGPVDFIAAIPRGYRLAKQLTRYLVEKDIDAMIVIDSPEFNHPVARWLRSRKKELPIFDLVAPTVWAWRPWRARKMKPYIDEVLAVLPFEPDVFKKLGGPLCTFIGHPAIDRAKRKNMSSTSFRQKHSISKEQPVLLMLPGSRKGEITRHMAIFSQAVKSYCAQIENVCIVMPVIPHMKNEVSRHLKQLKLKVLLIEDEDEKWGAFRAADLALAASGTVTLELTATHTPMVVAYRVDRLAYLLRWLVNVHSVVLPNLIMQKNVVPEFLNKDCTPLALSTALIELYRSDIVRTKQRDFLIEVTNEMGSSTSQETAERAAMVLIERLKLKTF